MEAVVAEADKPSADTSTTTKRGTLKPATRRRLGRWAPLASMLLAVAVGVAMPLRNASNFYYWDDTAGAAVGVWQRIAGELLSGNVPLLQIDMWRGGNFAAEAATGLFNPIMVGLMIGTYPIDNLAIAITVAKFVLFVIMAVGAYLLSRAYGAAPWPSALMGVVLPLSGYNLFMDGTAWINGTAIMAFTPWLWWSMKRYTEGKTRIIVVILMAYLLGSTGNPYGMLAMAAVFAAVCIEAGILGRWPAVRRLAIAGGLALLSCVVVYLPFVLTSSVGVRADSTTFNDEFFSPNLSDILGMSTGSLQAYIRSFGLPFFTVPVAYLAWFVLPLLPWLRFRELGKTWKHWSAALAFGLFYLLLLLGPSNLWMFRWPLRLIPFFYLAVILVFTIGLSRTWATDRLKLRTWLSAGIVVVGAWLAWSDRPLTWKWHLLFLAVTLVLVALFAWKRPNGAKLFAFLALSTLMLLFAQTTFMKTNNNVANYNFPQSKSAMKANFGERYKGLTVVVANRDTLPGNKLNPEGAWRDILFGNMFAAVGVESTTSYSGIGFTKLDNALCASYYGGSCVDAWPALWDKPPGGSERLADMLRVETVVRWNDPVPLAPGSSIATKETSPEAPAGWTKTEHNSQVSVYSRDNKLEFPEGRISALGSDVQVASDKSVSDTKESVRISSANGADRTITFARLAWPGYEASIDGRNLPVSTGPAGLLQVEVPEGTKDASLDISFTPPGYSIGMAALLAAGVGALGLEFWDRRGRRKRGPASSDPAPHEATATRSEQ